MIENNRFKIKTLDGYKDFAGLSQSDHNTYIKITFNNGEVVKCSDQHFFWTYSNSLIKAKDLLVGFDLVTSSGFSEIVELQVIDETITMFDIIEVETTDNHFLLSNEIKTHNCQFLTFEKSLVDADVLDFYQTAVVFEEINGFNIYKDSLDHDEGLIIITIDPSSGGIDNSVIQVWEISPDQVIELASFVDKYADASSIFEQLLWLQDFMRERWSYEPEDSLIIFERNGIGEGLTQILTQTEKAIENLMLPIFYDLKGKAGLHTSPTIKNKLALQFKNLIEYNKMKVNDSHFIDELYGFIRTKAGSYSAKSGYHDDRVMCAFLMVYYLMNVFADFAIGDFSVDKMMLVKPQDKIINHNDTETDPALIYRERMKKELENSNKSDDELLEDYKKQEREAYAKHAEMGSSIVEDDTVVDGLDDDTINKYDILPSVSL